VFIKKNKRIRMYPYQKQDSGKYRCLSVGNNSSVYQDVDVKIFGDDISYEIDKYIALSDNDHAFKSIVNRILNKTQTMESFTDIQKPRMLSMPNVLNILSNQPSAFLKWNQSVIYNCLAGIFLTRCSVTRFSSNRLKLKIY
jgi:hypothetical protein